MTIPEGYVQFFVEDAEPTDLDYALATDAVIKTCIRSIAADGTITELTGFLGGDMPGYAYGGGYLFSGKLNTRYSYSGNYYFVKTKTADGSRADYFVTGKTLKSHSAVKLPANSSVYGLRYGSPNDGKWVPVGSGVTVPLFNVTGTQLSEAATSLGTWQTCNYGQSAPEALGSLYNFNSAMALGVTLPTKDNFQTLINNCTFTWLTVRGQHGDVVKASRGFLFLPAHSSTNGFYWSSTGGNSSGSWALHIANNEVYDTGILDSSDKMAVRPITN